MNKKLFLLSIGIIIIILIIVLLIFLNTRKEENNNNLKIAVVIPLTGAVSEPGQDFLNGLMLAKEKLNSNNIDLYIEDSQSDAKDGVMACKKLLDTQDVDIIVSMQSAVVMPILSLADQYNKPLLATLISQNEFTQKSKNAFRLFTYAEQDAGLMADFANKKGYKKVSIVAINDEYGQSMAKYFKEKFKGSIIYEEKFEASESDFRTILAKTSGSDATYFLGYNPHYINFFKQREELGNNITILSNENMASNYIRSQVGSLYKNLYATAPPTILSDNIKEFKDEYYKKYGKMPDWTAPYGYDAYLVLDAIQKSGKKPIDALHQIKIQGLNGPISFDEKGESYLPLVVIEAKNGNVELVQQ